ncbi:MAG: hypothetical protein WCF90_08605 [Methanomicrobiales archaeon]
MIDTWLFAAIGFGFLALCALLRVIPGPERNDRNVSFTAAVTLGSSAAMVYCISTGNLLVLDTAIVIALILLIGIFVSIKIKGDRHL